MFCLFEAGGGHFCAMSRGAKINNYGNGLDRLEARRICGRILDMLPESVDINDALPAEIVARILQLYIMSASTHNERRIQWIKIRRVCTLWKRLSDQLPEFSTLTIRHTSLDLKKAAKSVALRIDAFPHLRSIRIYLPYMPSGSLFGHLMYSVAEAHGVRELVLESHKALSIEYDAVSIEYDREDRRINRINLWRADWDTVAWLLDGGFGRQQQIERLVLIGSHFRVLSESMRAAFRVNYLLTELVIPELGMRRLHPDLCRKSIVVHPFCLRHEGASNVPVGLAFSLIVAIPCLSRLEIGSVDLSCAACLAFLPEELEELVLHYPDQTNIYMPEESPQEDYPFRRLTLKHVPERPRGRGPLEVVQDDWASVQVFRDSVETLMAADTPNRGPSGDGSELLEAYRAYLIAQPAVDAACWTWNDCKHADGDFGCGTFSLTMHEDSGKIATKRRRQIADCRGRDAG